LKKIILFLLVTSSIFADAKVYVGVGYGMFDETFKSEKKEKNSTELAQIKIGYGKREAYAVEISLEYMQNSSKIFSSASSSSIDGDKYGMNVSLLKAFDFDIHVLPYMKVGFGSGYFDIDRALQDRIFYSSLNIGTGIFIPMGENFDLELAYEHRHTSYQSIDTVVEKINYQSGSNIAYFGFNARF